MDTKRDTVMEQELGKMVEFTLVAGRKIKCMVKVPTHGKAVPNMLALMKTTKNMDRVHIHGLMKIRILDSIRMARWRVMVSLPVPMETSTQVNSKTTRNTAWVLTFKQMTVSMWVPILMIIKMVMVNRCGTMVISMLDNIKKVRFKEKDHLSSQMEIDMMEILMKAASMVMVFTLGLLEQSGKVLISMEIKNMRVRVTIQVNKVLKVKVD